MRLEVHLTKAEAWALAQSYPILDWPHGTRKSQARRSAESKLLVALFSQLHEPKALAPVEPVSGGPDE